MSQVGIIGGGVVGLCTAYYLQQEGIEVTVIDEGDMTQGCSYLNAGMIVPSHVVPLAAPGVVAKGFKWMLKADSPFAFHFSADKDLLRWIWLFNRSANKKNIQRSVPHLRDISWLSKSLYRQLSKEDGFDFGYTERGLMMLYQTAGAEREEMTTADTANKAGVEAEILPADKVQQLEPELKVNIRGGIYFPGDAHLDPGKFMQDMKLYLQDKKIHFLTGSKVTGLNIDGSRKALIRTLNGTYSYDKIVIACGAASGLLLKKLPFTLPIQGGKGYSLMLKNIQRNIHVPSLLIEGKVAVTPMGKHLRVSGTMEIGNYSDQINEKRLRGIFRTLFEFYPELKDVNIDFTQAVSGLRPCSPDGLPYIGKLKKFPQITIATGHGMMGMSLGPATGKLVSEIITDRQTSMNVGVFDPERFEG